MKIKITNKKLTILASILLALYVSKMNPIPVIPTVLSSSVEKDTGVFRVKHVLDGDTIVLINDKKVRFIGIDAPELEHQGLNINKECYSDESKEYLKKLIEGKEVRIEKDVSNTDRYQRLLRYVYLKDTFINEVLVKEGYAKSYAYMPDVKLQATIDLAQKYAQSKKLGLWDICHEKN